jgi:hypothetical protein
MSDDGDYIRKILKGEIDGSVSPSRYRAIQESKQRQRKAPNGKPKK